jgi:phage baseplate assembly protein W
MASITTTTFVGSSSIGTVTVIKRNSAPTAPTNPITRNPFAILTQKEVGFRSFTYRDVSPNFTFHPITGDVAYYADFDAVSQSIKNIVLTERNERHFSQLSFGVGIERFLFKPLTQDLSSDVADEIISQITAHEPRAILYDVQAIGYPEQNGLEIRIKYGIKTIPHTEEIKLFIERA